MEAIIRYFVIVFTLVLFVILYVWQSVEMMKLKMVYKNESIVERRLIKKNDRLRYEIERFKNMRDIERFAEERGMKQITPDDFDTIIIEK